MGSWLVLLNVQHTGQNEISCLNIALKFSFIDLEEMTGLGFFWPNYEGMYRIDSLMCVSSQTLKML